MQPHTKVLMSLFPLALAACHPDAPDKPAAPPVANNGNAAEAPKPTAKLSAKFDISDLNQNVSACEDLFEHVNRKWFDANPMPQDVGRWGMSTVHANFTSKVLLDILKNAASNPQSSPIKKMLGTLYASGMDEQAIEKAGLDPISTQLALIDGIENRDGVVDYLIQQSSKGDSQVFTFGPTTDDRDSTKVIASATEDVVSLPSKEYYFDKQHQPIRDAYLGYIKNVFALSGANAGDATDLAQKALDLETKLAASSMSPLESRKVEIYYNPVNLQQAQQITPHFPWKTFIAAQGLQAAPTLSLTNERFFRSFDALLVDASVDQWKAYLKFRLIDKASPWLSRNFADNHFAFYKKTLGGQPSQEPRERRVLKDVETAMGEGLGQIYVQENFSPADKAKSIELIDKLKAAMKDRIQQSSWMSPQTQQRALVKLQSILVRAGYPDHWRDWSGLQLSQDGYYHNLAAARAFNYRHALSKIGQPKDLSQWFVTPQTLDAFYNPNDNSINIPAAMLQPPLFDSGNDLAINLGGIGAFIGHEITHAFDDQGSKFDGKGNRVDWWTPGDRKKFDALAQRLVTQFDTYKPIKSRPDIHVNGRFTLGENIADFGGIHLAYTALQTSIRQDPSLSAPIDGYTPNQRLFFAWARLWRSEMREPQQIMSLSSNPHSPTSVRTNAAPSNMPAFAEAFACKPTDPMTRAKDAQTMIW